MTLIELFGTMAMGFTISTFVLKTGRRILGMLSAGFWLLLAVTAYTSSTALWDAYYGLFMLSSIMVFACALLPVILREKKEEDIEVDDDESELMENIKESEEDRERIDRIFRPHKSRRRMSNFAKTGRIK